MSAPENEAIAVYGGSFDPPHISHVLAVGYVLSTAAVSRVIVVPAYEHPLGKRAASDFEHRYRMCELAMRDFKRVEVSRIEAELGGASRTVRTVEELARRLPEASFRLVVGADLLRETHRWHDFERVEKMAPLLVVGRAGHNGTSPVELPDVSSTFIRARLARADDVSAWVPREVIRYVEDNRLYRATTTG